MPNPIHTPDPTEAPALDAGEDNPDHLVGEEVEPDHDLDVDTFVQEPDEADELGEEAGR